MQILGMLCYIAEIMFEGGKGGGVTTSYIEIGTELNCMHMYLYLEKGGKGLLFIKIRLTAKYRNGRSGLLQTFAPF